MYKKKINSESERKEDKKSTAEGASRWVLHEVSELWADSRWLFGQDPKWRSRQQPKCPSFVLLTVVLTNQIVINQRQIFSSGSRKEGLHFCTHQYRNGISVFAKGYLIKRTLVIVTSPTKVKAQKCTEKYRKDD